MAELPAGPDTVDAPRRVLVVDNDPNITDLVTAMLSDEGYDVSELHEGDHASIASAVGRLEPDCILLDSADGPDFAGSWDEAAYLSHRGRSVPTVMFTAGADAVREAEDGSSDRAAAANFAGIIPKPFSLDQLLDTVATAVGRSEPFDRSRVADRQRTAELVNELRSRGASDVQTSSRREWATFISPHDERVYQLYWWQRLGRYVVGRYDADARLEIVGHYFERNEAIDAAFRH